jgi:starvation-inducible DNA-binding protein
MEIGTGLADTDRKQIAAELSRLLADSYTLYLRTQNYHWNVTGPMFQTLHLMFEGQYTELAMAVDEVAERIRSLGHPAPGTFGEFSRLTALDEDEGVPSADQMVANLLQGHETVVGTARGVLAAAEDSGDAATADLATRRIDVHEKTAWMLRSLEE